MPNNMTLKAAQFNPAVFIPSQYEFQPTDMSFLERSLERREARIQQAVERQSDIDKALGAIELQLNPSEAIFFNNYKQEIKNQIQEQIDAGDYGNAIRTATRLAGSVVSDPRILGRIESQKNYLKAEEANRARVEKGEVDIDAFDWWRINKGYKYTDDTDTNGNYIKGNVYNAPLLYNRYNPEAEAILAFREITPTKVNNDSNIPNGIDNYNGIRTRTESERVNAEDIKSILNDRWNNNATLRGQVEQALNVELYRLQELNNRLNTASNDEKQNIRNEITSLEQNIKHNGITISPKEYYEKTLLNSSIINTLSYNNIFTSNIYTSAAITGNRGNGTSGTTNDLLNNNQEITNGTPTEQSVTSPTHMNSINSNIVNSFNNNDYVNTENEE